MSAASSISGRDAISQDPDLLLQVLDALPFPVFIKNELLQFVYVNPAHCDLAGLAAEAIIGKTDADFLPPDEVARRLTLEKALVNGSSNEEAMESGANLPGQPVTQRSHRRRITSQVGAVFLVGTSTNIAEIKRREEQYQALAETVPVGLWQVSESGKTIYTNALLRDLLELTDSQATTERLLALLSGTSQEFPGSPIRFEIELARSDGKGSRVLVVSSGWLSRSGSAYRSAMISVVDISEIIELQRINEEVLRLNCELASSMGSLRDAQDEIVKRGSMSQLGQLTATVAHELRNPLGAVRTAVFLVERKIKDKGLGIEPQLQRISNGIARCDNIISQLLDYTRMKALQCELLDFDDWLVRTVEEEAQRLPEIVSIECLIGLNGQQIWFDPGRLNRVIINLMANASEAMVGRGDDPGKIYSLAPVMKIVTQFTERGIEISVTDNGPGISSRNLERIMEPLFTTKNFGTGLGLPAVEKILEQHGGGLAVRSKEGEGACFTAWLPVRQHGEVAA